MYPTGHLAINGILVVSWNGLMKIKDKHHQHIPMWPALTGAILPDLIDKVVTDYLHWMPYGRNYLHNLTAVVGVALLLKRMDVGISWCLGGLGHLLGDFVFVPLFWPWVSYDWPDETRNIAAGVVQTVADLSMGKPLSPLAAVVWQYNRIGVECIMLAGVLFFCQTSMLVDRIAHRERMLAMLLACVAWGYIIIRWDWPAFLNYAHYYGLSI